MSSKTSEIAPGIHMIECVVGTRPLQLYFLLGDQRSVLLDTGCAPDPERFIFPYLETLGMSPNDIDLVINTHPDLDHCGGNHALKHANPKALLTCGEADRELVEDPQTMWNLRYNAYAEAHGLQYRDESRKWIFEMLGQPQQVDFTWCGGETLRLSPEWTMEIHRTPGHSTGHLSLFDTRSGTMLSGDAVQGAVYLDVTGKPALCPTYLQVDEYLETVRHLESLPITRLATCHWPIKSGSEVREFLNETKEFVELAEKILLEELRSRPQGASLRALIQAAGPRLGDWPREVDAELMYALAGNVRRLVASQRVIELAGESPIRYRAV